MAFVLGYLIVPVFLLYTSLLVDSVSMKIWLVAGAGLWGLAPLAYSWLKEVKERKAAQKRNDAILANAYAGREVWCYDLGRYFSIDDDSRELIKVGISRSGAVSETRWALCGVEIRQALEYETFHRATDDGYEVALNVMSYRADLVGIADGSELANLVTISSPNGFRKVKGVKFGKSPDFKTDAPFECARYGYWDESRKSASGAEKAILDNIHKSELWQFFERISVRRKQLCDR